MGQLRRSTNGRRQRAKNRRTYKGRRPPLKPPVKGRNSILLEIANRVLMTEKSITVDGEVQSAGEVLREMVETYEGIVESEDLSPIHLSTVLFMSIKVAIQDGLGRQLLTDHRPFLIDVLERLPLASLDGRRLSAVIWAMGQLGSGMQSLEVDGAVGVYLDNVVRLCTKRLVNFKAKQIVNTITGLASMQCPNVNRLMSVLTSTCRLRRSQFSSEELCRLAWALGELNVAEGQAIMESLAVTIRQKLKSTTPSELTQCVWACGRLQVRISSSTMAVFMMKIEEHLRILKPREVTRVLWALTRISYRPRFEFLDMMEVYVANQSSAFEPSEIVDCLNALATFSYAPGTLLEVSKAFVLDHEGTFTAKELIHAIWSMSLLDVLDVSFLKMAIRKTASVWAPSSPDHQNDDMSLSMATVDDEDRHQEESTSMPTVDDEDLRRLYHCLLHLEILQGEAVRHLLPKQLEDDCRRAWYVAHPLSPEDTLSNILHSFEYMGYTVDPPKRDPVVGWPVHCIEGREGKVVIDVVTEESCFVNEQHRLQGLQKWRHKILKACGWEMIVIFEDTWMTMDFQEQIDYLSECLPSSIEKS